MAQGALTGPFLDRVLEFLKELIGEPLKFREERAKNAPLAVYYDQPVGGITGNTVYIINEAQSDSEYFTEMLIVFESASGLGRYMLTAFRAQPATGFPIAAGASFLQVQGHQNIRNFSMIAQAGQTLLFSRILFK